jgi:hypothetical protein
MSDKQRRLIQERSGGMCEALVSVNNTWSRCWQTPVEIHHMLTRARGGGALDKAGEIYHLVALCPGCHRLSDGAEAYEGGLLLEGSAIWDSTNNKPIYTGPDDYLKRKYGRDQT